MGTNRIASQKIVIRHLKIIVILKRFLIVLGDFRLCIHSAKKI